MDGRYLLLEFGVIANKKGMVMKKLVYFILLLLFVVSCSKISMEEESKAIENLQYDGESISWSPVLNANRYVLQINNGPEISVASPKDSGKVVYRFDSKGEDFDFSIEAVVKDGSEDNPNYQIRFKNVGTVSNLHIDEGILLWDSIPDADGYQVYRNGEILSSSVGTAECTIGVGSFTYKIRAVKGTLENPDSNNPYYSLWSESISGSKLSAPENLKYDSELLSWTPVTRASEYEVKINNQTYHTESNKLAYSAGEEDFTVSVKAIGKVEENLVDSSYCLEKKYTYIKPVENLYVNDGMLTWNHDDAVSGYRIKINGVEQGSILNGNQYANLSSGQSYRIQIRPIGRGDFWFSRWSNEITLTILRSPVVSFNDNTITWNQVTGCAGYDLKIEKDGNVIHSTSLGSDVFVYHYSFDDAGSYKVYVKATTLGISGIYESRYSLPYSVLRLATPTGATLTNRPLEQNQVFVSFDSVFGAQGYSLMADGVEIDSSKKDSSFSIDLRKLSTNNEQSSMKLSVIAKGGVSSEGAVLDSVKPLEFNVTRLATPRNLMINGNELSWDSVNSTNKYVLTIDGKRTEVTTTSFILTDMGIGPHEIYVQSMGNGENVITSGFSNPLEIRKLAVPDNLYIRDGILYWNPVQAATAYKVILGDGVYNADVNAFSLKGYESSINEGKGTQISVFAIGNGKDVVNSDVSVTRTISKYSRPTNVKIIGDTLVWNGASVNGINCTSYKLKITQQKGLSRSEKNEYIKAPSYEMSNFKAGTYSISIVAVGDNIQTIDSPASNTFTFTKLDTISGLKKQGNSYSWTPDGQASGYEIKLSKDSIWTTIKDSQYTPSFKTEGEFEVSIKVLGNGMQYADSDVYSFAQRVSCLPQPVVQKNLSLPNSFTISTKGNLITARIRTNPNAKGYRLIIGGIVRAEAEASKSDFVEMQYLMSTVGANYGVQVQIVGGCFASDGTYLLDSNKSTETTVVYKE